ncbi:hypothetical protein RN001_014322 [Aquatica leii]|uniref:Uncharacterized protein n=1 Tax=Aquatica leii TaxID=1421715 RepID=A0AAN7P290_9COLE|nr:hypothetical protein RN001_014322 [Aquatica leii]
MLGNTETDTIEADIQHTALSYESEDENMGRFHSRGRRGTPLYSKQDIREQYCISDRGLGALEADRRSLFSCLSTHQNSPCSTKASLLTVCVKQKIPSDENLQDLLKRYPFEYASYHRRARYPWGVPPPEIYPFDEEMECSYFRRKPRIDPRRYTWMPADDESVRLERPRSVLDHCNIITPPIPPPPPPVSSLILPLAFTYVKIKFCLLAEKFKRTPASMKTQATQTEACLGRKPLPPGQLNLSPRTIHRVKMVSQGAQTNGMIVNGRKLMKSYSEAGGRFATIPYGPEPIPNDVNHEPLQRTQSDEPPRSPFVLKSPPPELNLFENDSSSTHSDIETEQRNKFTPKLPKEIIIDFEPQLPFSSIEITKKRLIKTVSDGEMLLDQRRFSKLEDDVSPDKRLTSISHENIKIEPEIRSFTPYFQNLPIKNEGIFKNFDEHVFSSMSGSFDDSGLRPQDSIDEEFHENLIYRGRYLRRSGSSTSDDLLDQELRMRKSESVSTEEGVVPSLSLMFGRCSPFASNDSLANDIRDHSDGIWNESQATVLQVDSGTDNGTAHSSSEMASLTTPSNVSTSLLTPSSRRKHLLLMQHQQRSSMDTDALDEEIPEQVQTSRATAELPSISLSRPDQCSQQYLTTRSGPSPARRRRIPDPPSESPAPAVVPDLLLARTDSGKTNTDISESTTTTDDYITANSGTDSSKKNNGFVKETKEKQSIHTTQNGSSFESVSSMYALGKNDFLSDDMVVPSFSPIGIPEESSDVGSTLILTMRHGRSSPSGSSSSSGSYSINGSCPDLPQKPPVPSSRHVPSLSEDERSAHYSSSGYYESPLEDEHAWRSTKSDKLEWTEDEKKRRKKTFTLDIDKHKDGETKEKQKTILKQSKKTDETVSYSKDFLKTNDKPKRTKVRTRSPLQGHRKNHQLKKLSPSLIRSIDQFMQENNGQDKKPPLTSDESSSGVCGDQVTAAQISPRRNKKFKDSNRRKSIPRSPTGTRIRRKSEGIEDQSSSLPGTLAKRRSSMQANVPDCYNKSKLSPHSISPMESPNKKKRSPKTSPESLRLKALSAESLRSVSPGSDSVFYSDPSSHIALTEHHVHCLHCGKEVDIVTTDEPGKRSCHPADIVQPPASFADSPRIKQGRLFKKFEKRFRSEERSQGEKRHHRYRPDVRAKSEERGAKEENDRVKLRPMARSTDCGVEGIRAADSSPSVLPAAPENEDDLGVYNVPYVEGYWIYIDDREELQTWIKPESTGDDDLPRRDSASSIESTESEHEFRKRYQAITHRMVHRKSCLEMYKRQASKSFESDKTVIVQRLSGEFGFRIHGSKPVVVSAIEPDTPAESSGLEVGDIVLSVNRISVIDKSHSEVVKIAHAGSDTLTLEVARTCGVVSPVSGEVSIEEPIFSGFLWKLGGYTNENVSTTSWVRRWFVLRKDNCLYLYKNELEKQPVGALMLMNYDICKVDNSSSGVPARAFRFDLKRSGVLPLHLAADSDQSVVKWIDLLLRSVEKSQMADVWLEQTRRNLTLAVNAVPKPDCLGYLVKLGNQWKSWSKRYCVLKDACLYFYQDANAKNAFGVACLHGYRVQQTTAGSKKHAFEIIPTDPNHKHFYFYTESDADRKRWVAALEYSIDRWLKVG